MFCCQGSFNSSDSTCGTSTRGNNSLFAVDPGYIIFNRSSGSTSPNDTATVTSTVTLTGATVESVTVTPTATAAGTAAPPLPTSNREATVGMAVGLPLGIALLGFVGLLWRLRRETTRLRKDKEKWEEKYIALLESKRELSRSGIVTHGPDERLIRPHQLEDTTIRELGC